MLWRFSCISVLCCLAAYPAGDARSAVQAAQDFERKLSQLPLSLAIQFRVQAAQTLQPRHPDLAHQFAGAALEQLRKEKDIKVGTPVIRALIAASPDEAIPVLSSASPNAMLVIIATLAPEHPDQALALYRSALHDGKVDFHALSPLIMQFAKERPSMASELLESLVDNYDFSNLEPWDAGG
ncbi:MAG TPA: hypothetical protein VKU19_17970 [Bryobacteraceae bacterium]|nr:hypothetical protein [Bryobacteraceae bacterium]